MTREVIPRCWDCRCQIPNKQDVCTLDGLTLCWVDAAWRQRWKQAREDRTEAEHRGED